MGDDVWPLEKGLFTTHLEEQAASLGMTEYRGGVARVAAALRATLRSDLVTGESADVPSSPIPCKVACSVLHNGLCRTRDSVILKPALALADSFHTFFRTARSGDFSS